MNPPTAKGKLGNPSFKLEFELKGLKMAPKGCKSSKIRICVNNETLGPGKTANRASGPPDLSDATPHGTEQARSTKPAVRHEQHKQINNGPA